MSEETIFVVDDEPESAELIKYYLEEGGFEVEVLMGGMECLGSLSKKPSAICLDMFMPEMDGLETLKAIKKMDEVIPVIMVTNDDNVDSVIIAMKLGADDYIIKPIDKLRLCTTLEKAIEKSRLSRQVRDLQTKLKNDYSYKNIIGNTHGMKKMFDQLEKIKNSNINVFIGGETGTGKELVARAIHYNSYEGTRPFIDINCGAIPENLQENELFGHERGAYTGAVETKKGKVELADGGTLFLDEVAEMTLNTQVKLLRFLEEKTFERVGGTKKIKVYLRIISATNKDLKQAVKDGTFREDLLYRLVVFPIIVPPLRERIEDIPMLSSHFIRKYQDDVNKGIKIIDTEALEALMNYSWPGNVRELENVIYRAMICTEDGVIGLDSLPDEIIPNREELIERYQFDKDNQVQTERDALSRSNSVADGPIEFITLEAAEKNTIISTLKITNGNVSEAARKLCLSRATFYRKLKRHGLKQTFQLPAG